ncbi:hypothetical protein [Streptomyces sp. CAU 1734]|uniref:hypothetical protein n=1 Tax=Streptomyces sp. CAU 1734 TaxID=3140360 RepID=UPI003260EEBA
MTPADELRAAATRLREAATAASTNRAGEPTASWSTEERYSDYPAGGNRLFGDFFTREDGRVTAWPLLFRGGSREREARMETQHAQYIVLMQPAAGLALAAWLDQAADALTGAAVPDTEPALAVARQILGTTPTGEDQ